MMGRRRMETPGRGVVMHRGATCSVRRNAAARLPPHPGGDPAPCPMPRCRTAATHQALLCQHLQVQLPEGGLRDEHHAALGRSGSRGSHLHRLTSERASERAGERVSE